MIAAEFSKKVALVTGSSGIARAVALRLAMGGAQVCTLGVDREANVSLKEAAKAGSLNIEALEGDVSVDHEVAQAVQETVRRWGGLDIIVNTAAIHPYGDAVETDFATWNRCMAVNIGGIYLTAHHGVPEMRKRGGGAIVNLASVQGYACQKGVSAYATTKGAIHALTRSLALDFAKDHIRVNSVSPGSVRTPMLERAARTFDGPNSDVEAVFRRFGAAHPIGRIGEADEVAELIAFLASDKAGFCTGADYVIDGGLKAGLGVA